MTVKQENAIQQELSLDNTPSSEQTGLVKNAVDAHLDPRSNEPMLWGLFGFGGMVAAFALPSLITCLIIAGFSDGHTGFHILETMSHWWGAGALFIIVFGAAFHSIHRIYHTMHDLKMHTNLMLQVVVYGLALCISLAAAVCLGIYYFG